MVNFQELALNWGAATWEMLLDSALLLLIGLGLAGLLRLVLSEGRINRFLAGGGPGPVFKAALLGIPLPLCSCSVLPVAHQLRQSGVSKGGTVAFLISTPESGIDSMILTWTLMDPVMTIARPVTAFLTAFTAGLLENRSDPEPINNPRPSDPETSCCSCESDKPDATSSLPNRIWTGLKYAYTDLLDDLAVYLVVGYVLAGLVAVVWGPQAGGLPEFLQTGWGGYVGALLIGLPLYICAVSSTPLAAALLVTGFSPGATLLFLMVGPATNLASLVVVSKVLKGWAVLRYLGSIIVVSLVCALILDILYPMFKLSLSPASHSVLHQGPGTWWNWAAAVALTGGVLWFTGRKLLKRLF
ncbi:MAG: SO_0444 family Cu/Zn efflux transporter [candidate division Zixibacteria bacterium]|nr:SO_0444 family Cu/Zn efflux transporter [candidate division Zixibacteria bacterium]MDH3938252.1 SO_0444 family Cu/Zn efflux transporter [candidate division Zixibacteria bacterium]MDH4034524.1 SO_0444 family Cu/Zn efflux transporter [candidate division Zixibacteria bacterium]